AVGRLRVAWPARRRGPAPGPPDGAPHRGAAGPAGGGSPRTTHGRARRPVRRPGDPTAAPPVGPATVAPVGGDPVDQADVRRRVEAALAGFLGGQRDRLRAIDRGLLPLADAIDALVLGAGKRLLPAFGYWGFRGAGGGGSDAVGAALAPPELVQARALLH